MPQNFGSAIYLCLRLLLDIGCISEQPIWWFGSINLLLEHLQFALESLLFLREVVEVVVCFLAVPERFFVQ